MRRPPRRHQSAAGQIGPTAPEHPPKHRAAAETRKRPRPAENCQIRALLVGAPPRTRTPNPRIKGLVNTVAIGPVRRRQSYIPLLAHWLRPPCATGCPSVDGARAPDEHPYIASGTP